MAKQRSLLNRLINPLKKTEKEKQDSLSETLDYLLDLLERSKKHNAIKRMQTKQFVLINLGMNFLLFVDGRNVKKIQTIIDKVTLDE